jgi:hypothetical protein
MYNNVFYKIYVAIYAGGDIKNNIFYQVTAGVPTDAGNLVATNDPFVDGDNGDFHLKANSAAQDAGADLGSLYNTDPDGNTRGADGKWDMGVYEYTNTGVSWQLAEGSWQAPPLPAKNFNILGQLIPGSNHTGIYLKVPENRDQVYKITIIQ